MSSQFPLDGVQSDYFFPGKTIQSKRCKFVSLFFVVVVWFVLSSMNASWIIQTHQSWNLSTMTKVVGRRRFKSWQYREHKSKSRKKREREKEKKEFSSERAKERVILLSKKPWSLDLLWMQSRAAKEPTNNMKQKKEEKKCPLLIITNCRIPRHRDWWSSARTSNLFNSWMQQMRQLSH